MEVINANLDRIKAPGNGAKVYKDECFYSFDSPVSPSGLYVCLNRWLGVGERFLNKYSNRTDNKVFLHIKRTLKEKKEKEGVPEKVSKLAINMEGGFQTDNPEEWDEELKIVVLPGKDKIDINDPALPVAIQLAVAGIRVATSATKQNILDAASGTWDGEALVLSKHAENLKQDDNPPRIPPSGWKCVKCDLTDNLWLNLTDGSIMCGRKFFDGSGGNDHAVNHFKEGHGGGPLAVKLGTITRDGKADVFSYDEDDMVLDPHLEKHLAHFGIKLTSCEKTDKSMNEINIEMNNRIGEFSRCEERGQKLLPVWGPNMTGLHNLGNTCYMNSVLQVLFTIPEIIACYTKSEWLDRGDLADPANDLTLQLAKLCTGLTSGDYSQAREGEEVTECNPGVSPLMFKHLVGKGHPEFSSNRQQDAQEFYLHLLNMMEKVHKKTPSSPAPIKSLQFQCEDRFQCSSSGQVRYKRRLEDYLPLSIPIEAATNAGDVSQYLSRKAEAEAKGERLTGEDIVRANIPVGKVLETFIAAGDVEDFFSSAIQSKTTASKTVRLATFPDYLVIQLLKFQVDENWQPCKLDCEVDMPDKLDLSSLRGSGIQTGEVELPEESGGEQQEEVKIDENVVAQLVDMGFGREGCRRAVFNTGNNGVEPAMSWVMEHMGDPDFNSSFHPGGKKGNTKVCTANDDVIMMVMDMGFTRDQAMTALRNTDNNLERAIEWIFSHPDGEDPVVSESFQDSSLPDTTDGIPRYNLSAFITHMGSSNHSGHYVCHIKDQEGKWIIFNDNKVQQSVTPPKELGYLYLYKREGL